MSCTCDTARLVLPSYLDGELAARSRQELEDHFAECPLCSFEAEKSGEWLFNLRNSIQVHNTPPCFLESLEKNLIESLSRIRRARRDFLLQASIWAVIMAIVGSAVIFLADFL